MLDLPNASFAIDIVKPYADGTIWRFRQLSRLRSRYLHTRNIAPPHAQGRLNYQVQHPR